ncbi:MAG TPA: RNase H family protein [Jatrophihabitantaceae bacterium]|nr:RNase H family protein [Jatrophihabitantaceae bacterium]
MRRHILAHGHHSFTVYRLAVLVVISGLPGTGKSTVGAAVARRSRAVWLSVDEVEDALLGVGLPSDWTTGVAAYEAVGAAAAENLRLGHVVIVDAVNDSEPARDTWRRAAEAASEPLVFVLLTPPPEREHRLRLQGRTRYLSHQSEPTWEQVQARVETYERWRDPPLSIDSGQPLDVVVDEVAAIVATQTVSHHFDSGEPRDDPRMSKTRKKESVSFTVYADGSGTPTGGPAGIGFVVLSDGLPFSEESIPLADANHQQAELLAATRALDSLPEGQDIVLYSDSRYVVKGFTKVDGAGEYLPKWRERGWRTGSGPLANLPLWHGLIAAVERHRRVRFKWIRGHVVKCPTCSHNGADRITNTEDGYEVASCGDEWHDHAEGNKRADRLAGEATRAARLASESSRS